MPLDDLCLGPVILGKLYDRLFIDLEGLFHLSDDFHVLLDEPGLIPVFLSKVVDNLLQMGVLSGCLH